MNTCKCTNHYEILSHNSEMVSYYFWGFVFQMVEMVFHSTGILLVGNYFSFLLIVIVF